MDRIRLQKNVRIARALGWKIITQTEMEAFGIQENGKLKSEIPDFCAQPVEDVLHLLSARYVLWHLFYDQITKSYRFVGSVPYLDTTRRFIDVIVRPDAVWEAIDFLIDKNFSARVVKASDYKKFQPKNFETPQLLPVGRQNISLP